MPSPLVAKSPDTNNNASRGPSIKLKPVITKKAPPKRSPITPTPKPAALTSPLTNNKTKVAFKTLSNFNKIHIKNPVEISKFFI